MDVVERLAQQAAETINGGEFYDGKWYTEGQRQAWRKALTPAADEIERLREIIDRVSDWCEVNNPRVLMEDYYETKIKRLREALQYYAEKKQEDWVNVSGADDGVIARAALKEMR